MRRLGPFAVYSSVFLVVLSLGVISPMLKDIQQDLGVSYGAAYWSTGFGALVLSASQTCADALLNHRSLELRDDP